MEGSKIEAIKAMIISRPGALVEAAFLFLCLTYGALGGYAQAKDLPPTAVRIPEAGLSVSLPSTWSSNPEKTERSGRTLYRFQRSPITDPSGQRIIPNFAVVIESVPPDQDVIEYSTEKRLKSPFKVLKVITSENGEFGDVSGIGYIATYNDPPQMVHKVYVVHTIIGDKGIQIFVDGTESVFDTLDSEYKSILRSFKLMSKAP